jgi:predicted regulator of Ras-like GTPase activity (Roadblock/LC7/MglB family)
VVSDLRRSIPELNGVMVASVDGLSVAHDLPEADAERMAAMAATALGLGKRISERTNLGEMQETVVRGANGYLVVYAAGEQAVLVLSGPFNSNLGLMRIEARAASWAVAQGHRRDRQRRRSRAVDTTPTQGGSATRGLPPRFNRVGSRTLV